MAARKPKPEGEDSAKQNQLRFTVGDEDMKLVTELNRLWGAKSQADAPLFIFRKGIPYARAYYKQMIESGVASVAEQAESQPEPDSEPNHLRLLLIRMATGSWVSDEELSEMAYQTDLPVEVLERLRDCLTPKKEEINAHRG